MKQEAVSPEGVVSEVLPSAMFRVDLANGHRLLATTAGKMRKFRIRIIEGDRVTVEMSPYDIDKGRVIFRHKDTNAAPRTGAPPRGNQQFRRR